MIRKEVNIRSALYLKTAYEKNNLPLHLTQKFLGDAEPSGYPSTLGPQSNKGETFKFLKNLSVMHLS